MKFSIFKLVYYLLTFSHNFIHEEQQFRKFIQAYNKSYTFGSHEYWHRFQIFQRALGKITILNNNRKHPTSAFFGLTPYADLTLSEFKKKVINSPYNGRKLNVYKQRLDLTQSKPILNNLDFKQMLNVPLAVDWRTKGIIGDVVAQGKCGSCWAHTIVDTISSMVALNTGQYVKLSAQQLLDCSDNNYGCDGGDLCQGLLWLAQNNITLLTDQEYPYKFHSGNCLKPKTTKGVQIYTNFTCHSEIGHEENMVQLLANHGPLMAAADASFWQYYINGTIHDNCGNDANHAVQIVGYNLNDTIPYYIIRNTWGTQWGMNGYLQVAIGNNTCDISAEVAAVWAKSDN